MTVCLVRYHRITNFCAKFGLCCSHSVRDDRLSHSPRQKVNCGWNCMCSTKTKLKLWCNICISGLIQYWHRVQCFIVLVCCDKFLMSLFAVGEIWAERNDFVSTLYCYKTDLLMQVVLFGLIVLIFSPFLVKYLNFPVRNRSCEATGLTGFIGLDRPIAGDVRPPTRKSGKLPGKLAAIKQCIHSLASSPNTVFNFSVKIFFSCFPI